MEDFYESKYLETSVALSTEIDNDNLSYHNNDSNNGYRNAWKTVTGSGPFFGSLDNHLLATRSESFPHDITTTPAFQSHFLRHHDPLNTAGSSLYGFDQLTQSTISSTSNQFFQTGQSNLYSTPGLVSLSLYQNDSKLYPGVSTNNSSMYHAMPGNGILGRYSNMSSFAHGNSDYCLHSNKCINNTSPPSQIGSATSSHSLSPHQFCSSLQIQDQLNYDPRDLEVFSEKFKQRRIKLGVTQADVGKALGCLKLFGVGSLSQSTICRFESLTLSHNNMVALKPILHAWLEEAELQASDRQKNPDLFKDGMDRKRKRTSITDAEKRSLEAYFAVQPRPSSEKISQISDKLNLKKNVVRVWFCNQRQKQKRMKFTTVNADHHTA